MSSYLTQLYYMETFTSVDVSELSRKYRTDSPAYLMLLTNKRYERIKGRVLDYGRRHKAYIKEEDSASPTVSLEDIMITSSIEVHKGIDFPPYTYRGNTYTQSWMMMESSY